MESLILHFFISTFKGIQNVLSSILNAVTRPISFKTFNNFRISDWNDQFFRLEVWRTRRSQLSLVLSLLIVLNKRLWLSILLNELWLNILSHIMKLLIGLIMPVVIRHLLRIQRVVRLAMSLHDLNRALHWRLSINLTATTLHLLCLNDICHVGCGALVIRSSLRRILKLLLLLKFQWLIWSEKHLLRGWWSHCAALLLDAAHDCSLRKGASFSRNDVVTLISFGGANALTMGCHAFLGLELLKSLVMVKSPIMFPWILFKGWWDATVSWDRGGELWALSHRHSAHARGWSSQLVFDIIVKLLDSLEPKVTHSELE
jgi:hypothetical protein